MFFCLVGVVFMKLLEIYSFLNNIKEVEKDNVLNWIMDLLYNVMEGFRYLYVCVVKFM